MRILFSFFIAIITALPSFTTTLLVSAEDGIDVVPTCDIDMITLCDEDAHRYCYLDSEFKPVCGNCLDGFIEWRARCISDEAVNLALFLSVYEPQYLDTLSTQERTALLTESIQFIQGYQNQNPPNPFLLTLNTFSADTVRESEAIRGFNTNGTSIEPLPKFQPASTGATTTTNLSSSIDWVKLGAVTAVQDQGRCACSHANSIVGAIEGISAIRNGFLNSLSVQQFISCDDSNNGCNGGSLLNAMTFALGSEKGISSAMKYPFTDGDGTTTTTCTTTSEGAVAVSEAFSVVDFEDTFTFEERSIRMKQALAESPVAVVLKTLCPLFTNYQNGVLTVDDGCTCDDAYCGDHAVLMVGYNDSAEIPYWKIKNSWTAAWGEEGYVRISQAQKGDYGLFGVLTHGIMPFLTLNLTSGEVSEIKVVPRMEDDGPLLEWWAWLLIALAACVVIFFIFSCFTGMLCPRKNPKEEETE